MDNKGLELEKTALGFELGSTRIKGVLIGPNHRLIASGEYEWENRYQDGIWTYYLEDVWKGLQEVYKQLSNEVKDKYGTFLTKVGSIGISAMMHGYLPFDAKGNQLTAFRTWRNTTTQKAVEELTSLFQFNIPLRWSVAHLYQAMLNKETHVQEVDFLTTLSGYVHWKLTGEKVIGIGDASGMFPINTESAEFDHNMMEKFNRLTRRFDHNWSLEHILPKIQVAGSHAGLLTESGAKLLDPIGVLQSGIPFCPPEGDAGTGMVATNSIAERTGNVSAGTSIFAMVVLEKGLTSYYKEIDMVTTPTGRPTAMVHCNNFTSDINAWVNLFAELLEVMGKKVDVGELITTLFQQAMKGEMDTDGIVSCNYYSGEPITGFEEGRPLLARMPNSKLTLPNFMRAQIYSALATLEIGMNILTANEKVKVDYILGHGGFFQTENVGQQLMANALKVPVSVMETAQEGGPWGMAILGKYSIDKGGEKSLEQYLDRVVFNEEKSKTITPSEDGMKAFDRYIKIYDSILKVERAATDYLMN